MSVKKYIGWIDHGCYPGETLFINGYDYDQTLKHLKKMRKKKGVNKKVMDCWIESVRAHENTFRSNNWFCGICDVAPKDSDRFSKYTIISLTTGFKKCDFDYTRVAHEVLHLCQFYLPDLLDRDTEVEAEAYFHTHIMGQILNVINN